MMNLKWILNTNILLLLIIVGVTPCKAQTRAEQKITLEELFSLVLERNPTLNTDRLNIDIAKQNKDVQKNALLPDISISGNAYFLSNATILDKYFSKVTTSEMPHFGNSYSLEASQLLYKGGAIKNAISISSIQESIAQLQFTNNQQAIKLLVAEYYLDLQKMYNQKQVFGKNIELAERQLENINKFFKQGMVTQNDVIRGQLQISNFRLELQNIEANILIYNNQLLIAAGIEEEVMLIPTEAKIDEPLNYYEEKYFQLAAVENHPSIQMAEKNVDMAEKNVDIAKSDRLPTIALFAGNGLQRPITSSTPVLDMYSNVWQAGVSVSFNISSIYKAPKNIRLNSLRLDQSKLAVNEEKKYREANVQEAYTLYKLAISQTEMIKTNQDLANENYRIIQTKYNNQLALLVDLLDAGNAKLTADLQYTNAKINIIQKHYRLLREIGKL